MATVIHKATSRGQSEHGWLHSRHTFSFDDYHNPDRMDFGRLRVLNDDVVEPGSGFGTHSHRNMEIVSIPLSGTLSHKDSMGNVHTLGSGEIQVMSAGTGITHSEYNHSQDQPVNFLQIWVRPREMDLLPSYSQKAFSPDRRRNRFQVVVSPDGSEHSLAINQSAWFSLADIQSGKAINYERKRAVDGLYLFVIEGAIRANGIELAQRDATGFTETKNIEITALAPSKVLCIEVPVD